MFWTGNYTTEPTCNDPALNITTLTVFGDMPMYLYLNSETGKYTLLDDLAWAQSQAVPGSTIIDNCGNTFEA